MTLADLVVEQFPELEWSSIQHLPLCDIFTIAYKGNIIGYYNPAHNILKLDRPSIKRFCLP